MTPSNTRLPERGISMNRSHIYTGNTYRLHSVFDKAGRGEPVSIVFLGASITLGYKIDEKYLFTTAVQNYFRDRFQSPDIACHNLSVAGMPSLHGLQLAYFDVESYSPDLIVIDYSVNDRKDSAHREAFESLLVKCLSLPSQPAVISFFVKNHSGYTCAAQMSAVCEHYAIPYVNIGEQLEQDIRQGTIQWEQFSYDDCHPGPDGHGYIGKCLLRLFEAAANIPATDDCLPAQHFYNSELASLRFYPSPWESTPDCRPAPLEIEICCRTLFLVYLVDITEDCGRAHLSVDGTLCCRLDSYRVHEWEHPAYEVIHLSKEKVKHHISLDMPKGESDKRFHLLHLGYV